MIQIKNIVITTEILKFISVIDEFKGKWQATQDLAPARLSSLKRIATIESAWQGSDSCRRSDRPKFTGNRGSLEVAEADFKSVRPRFHPSPIPRTNGSIE